GASRGVHAAIDVASATTVPTISTAPTPRAIERSCVSARPEAWTGPGRRTQDNANGDRRERETAQNRCLCVEKATVTTRRRLLGGNLVDRIVQLLQILACLVLRLRRHLELGRHAVDV